MGDFKYHVLSDDQLRGRITARLAQIEYEHFDACMNIEALQTAIDGGDDSDGTRANLIEQKRVVLISEAKLKVLTQALEELSPSVPVPPPPGPEITRS